MGREGPPPKDQRCKTCAWWNEMDSGLGLCRRGLPTMNRYSDSGRWPETVSEDWCSQWAASRGWLEPLEDDGK